MEKLSKDQKLKITRIGRGLTLEEVAKKLFVSPSFVHLMEQGKRKVPDDVEAILDFDKGIEWYLTIKAALSKEEFLDKDALNAIDILNKVVGIR